MPRVLVIAGSDSSGGAGIARDLSVLAEHHVEACCALTAVTAQTDDRVVNVHHVPPAVIQQQITSALQAHPIDAIKIGMLGNGETVIAVANALAGHAHIPLVLDPVLRSSSGGCLLDDEGIAQLRSRLLPRTLLLTPNVLETALLLGEKVGTDKAQLIAQGKQLLDLGPVAVLIKGGHREDRLATDLLLQRHEAVIDISAARIAAEMRGTGCALASAIAALIAQGVPLESACQRAKRYVHNKIQSLCVA